MKFKILSILFAVLFVIFSSISVNAQDWRRQERRREQGRREEEKRRQNDSDERRAFQEARRFDREGRVRFIVSLGGVKLVGYYDRKNRFHSCGYYDRFGRFYRN